MRYAEPIPAGAVDPDPDREYEKQREIRHLGAASGWPCRARDDAEADLPDLSRGQHADDDPYFRVSSW